MPEFVAEISDLLEKDKSRIEKEVQALVSEEEKRKLVSLFIDDVMKGAKQMDENELVRLGRESKRGRAEKLRRMGLI